MSERDLIVVTADADAKLAVETLLSRNQSLGIRPVEFRCVRYQGRDAGCRSLVHDFLRPFCRQYGHALVVFDRHGCGDDRERRAIEADVELRLTANGWNECAAVVIDPELEAWVWSPSPAVGHALGWTANEPQLRTWLHDRGMLQPGHAKPDVPKEAMHAALRKAGRPTSPAIFAEIAERVSFASCVDPAFEKLVATLRKWFA
jgi:hypothetical protein